LERVDQLRAVIKRKEYRGHPLAAIVSECLDAIIRLKGDVTAANAAIKRLQKGQ
jgi:hypothetical protein